jgi:phosphoribosylaminoimidazolecarboxamide formyltransferase / IMP cyclohydrolase
VGGVPGELRSLLAAEAFEHVALYDAAIASWFRTRSQGEGLPHALAVGLERIAELRYGENPHQQAALYREALSAGPLGGAEILQGKQMSFNNWLDAEAARGLAGVLAEHAAVIVKHNNPCGAAVAATPAAAYRSAYESDPTSAFGGVVAFNTTVDEEAAAAMADVFTEVVVAPGYTDGALDSFGRREKLRLLRAPAPVGSGLDVRAFEGGAVVQERDVIAESRIDMKVVSRREPSEEEWDDLLFGWTVAAWVKSNTIVLARGRATVGVGAGQMSRVDAVDIACRKAGPRAPGSVAASDAFFPFRDGVDRAAEAGVTAVIQPGGSVRDNEVVEAADQHGMAMVLTGRRHFRH